MGSGWPPSLTLETESVLRLFTGENFYSSADAAVREAVLNAIDAAGRRKQTEGALEQKIEVAFHREDLSIVVCDNGDGMDGGDLTDLFAKVGASASVLAQGKQDYTAIGEFGIGALSYFLLCDRYHIQTRKEERDPIGLAFSKAMLDGRTPAEELAPERESTGTKLTLFVKSRGLFDLAVQRFPHWMRDVEGLSARVEPDGASLNQGGLTRQIRPVPTPEPPSWIESSDLGPPQDLDVWDRYDGVGQVDVLYRGVFVERLELEQLWAIEGALHVDPKHFRPKLNREGFVGDSLKAQLTPFLRAVHPRVLQEAIACIGDLLRTRDDWSFSKAITLWLAVPRSPECASSERFGQEGAFVKRRFMVLA